MADWDKTKKIRKYEQAVAKHAVKNACDAGREPTRTTEEQNQRRFSQLTASTKRHKMGTDVLVDSFDCR